MELESIIKELVYCPDKDKAKKIIEFIDPVELSSQYMKILITYGKTIKSMEQDFVALSKEISEMNNTMNNNDGIISKEQQVKKELLHSKQMLLSQKMLEKGDTKQLMQLKYSLVAEEITEKEYKTKRDSLLNNIILTRSYIYKTKEHLKSWMVKNEIVNDDNEWYEKNGIYLDGNKRDNTIVDINKFNSSREICDLLQFCKNKKMSILPANDEMKEVIAMSICAPEYLVQQEMNMATLDQNKKI